MTTVILIAILIVLLILACTFGLLKKSGKKDHRRDPYADVMTNIALGANSGVLPDPSISVCIPSADMSYSYLMNQQQQQQLQQQQQNNSSQRGSYSGSGHMDPNFSSDSQFQLRGSPHHHKGQQQQQQQYMQQFPSPHHLSSSQPSHYGPNDGRMSPRSPVNRGTSPIPTSASAGAYNVLLDPRFMAPAPRSVMGSAEAEFQNDFVEVFPMHHLEPKPDLN